VIDSREKDSLNNELDRVGEQIERTLELSEKSVERYVKNFDQDIIFYVGGGPNEATAMYGAAKVMEALSLEGVAVELEEWAHLQFHTTFENTPYMLIAPPGSSYDRVIEQAVGIKESGGMLTSIVDEEDKQVKSESEYVFRVHGPDMEAFSPLVYCVPLQLLAVDLADARNTSMQMRLDERRKEINFQQIFHSEIQG
jgi:glucosamine--fructose-6-phosphate aminotransferase (isomerizing)